ncbi:MAG TPA: cytochrome c oxidase subunit II [Solirubrobacteraceae bacterium]|nr:cytochrome c oxidase subunit II [Solirubrobacteraceae bacterium]
MLTGAHHAWLFAAGLIDTHHEYDHLFGIYVPIAAGVFAVVVLAVGFALVRYRQTSSRVAGGRSENNPVELSYAVGLTLVVALLLYLTFSAEHNVDTVSARERPALTIDVTASQWEWTFAYPADGITAHSGTVGRQPLVVPTGEAIRFRLTSADVIHSFWIPELRFKRDAIPGMAETVTLSFSRPGRFSGQCAEFCGLRHPEMVFPVQAMTPARFAAWVSAHRRPAS